MPKKPLDRQVVWQRKQRRAGNCNQCGSKAARKTVAGRRRVLSRCERCLAHLAVLRARARKLRRRKP
jgi:primosomal protein N'